MKKSGSTNEESAQARQRAGAEIKEALKNFKGTIKKCPTREARGVPLPGAGCAASWGASLLGQQAYKGNWIKMSKESQRRRSMRMNGPATPRQLSVLREHGAILRDGISKREAWGIVRQLKLARTQLRARGRK